MMFPHEKHGMKQAIWRTDPSQAGIVGSMGDTGSHCENLLQYITGEENALRIKIYASQGAIVWDQENPNAMHVYRYNEPRQTLTRAHHEYLSASAKVATRVPTGHPEGYLEAFANIYCGVVEAVRRYIDGAPMKTEEYNFPTVYDGLRGMRFIAAAAESNRQGAVWVQV